VTWQDRDNKSEEFGSELRPRITTVAYTCRPVWQLLSICVPIDHFVQLFEPKLNLNIHEHCA